MICGYDELPLQSSILSFADLTAHNRNEVKYSTYSHGARKPVFGVQQGLTQTRLCSHRRRLET